MFFNFYNYFLSIKFLSNSRVKIIVLQKLFFSWQFKIHLEGPIQQIADEIKFLPKTTGIFLSLELKDIVSKVSTTKIKNNKHIRSTTTFQIEPKLPCALEDSAIQIIIRPENKTSKNVLSFITRKEKIENIINKTQQLSCFPDILSVSTIDGIYLINKIAPDIKNKIFYIIQAKSNDCCCFLVKNNIALASRSFSFSNEENENLLEIQNTITYFQKQIEENPEFILAWNLPLKLKHKMEESITTPIQNLSKPTFIKNLSQEIWEEAGDLIANILQSAEKNEINFIKNSKKSSLIVKKQIKKFLPSFFKIGLFFILFYSSVNIFQLTQIKNKIRHSLNSIECKFDLPKKTSSKSLDEILSSLKKHQEFLTQHEDFPLVPNIPKPSHLITWISSNKDLSSIKFFINSLTYKIEKYPDKQNKKESYLIKVSLQGRLDDPSSGKKLQQILKHANPYKSSKDPFEWEQKNVFFSSSFYLKDKTPY